MENRTGTMGNSTRREFLEVAAGTAGLAIAGSAKLAWAGSAGANRGPSRAPDPTSAPAPALPEGSNLLTDPQYEMGARYRLGRFIGRGADPAQAEAVFRSLPN